jgi:hypothetical protein
VPIWQESEWAEHQMKLILLLCTSSSSHSYFSPACAASQLDSQQMLAMIAVRPQLVNRVFFCDEAHSYTGITRGIGRSLSGEEATTLTSKIKIGYSFIICYGPGSPVRGIIHWRCYVGGGNGKLFARFVAECAKIIGALSRGVEGLQSPWPASHEHVDSGWDSEPEGRGSQAPGSGMAVIVTGSEKAEIQHLKRVRQENSSWCILQALRWRAMQEVEEELRSARGRRRPSSPASRPGGRPRTSSSTAPPPDSDLFGWMSPPFSAALHGGPMVRMSVMYSDCHHSVIPCCASAEFFTFVVPVIWTRVT